MKLAILFLSCGLIISAVLAQQRPSQGVKPQSEYERRVQEENEKHGWGEGKLKGGDPAPDFNLKRLHSEGRVRLSGIANKKPVALVFGTYT